MSEAQPDLPVGDPPAVEPAPEPAAAPAVTPNSFESFKAGLPDELRANPLWDQYKERGLEGVAKDLVEQGRLIGSETRISRPAADASAEDWAKFYNTMGRPESAEGYDLGDFAPPEGLPWDHEQQKRLTERMHGIGLTNDQMTQAITALSEEQNADFVKSISLAEESATAARDELREEWGVAYDSNVELAEKMWVHAFGDKASGIGEVEIPGYGKFGAIPAVVRAFAKIGQSLAEDRLEPGSGGPPSASLMTRPAAQAEYERMRDDPAISKILTNTSDPEHKATMRRWTQIGKMATPE